MGSFEKRHKLTKKVMNLQYYLSKKIFSERKSGSALAKTSRVIATVSVAVSIAVIVAAIAISQGFRREIGDKCAGFGGDIWISAAGTPLYNTDYPVFVGKRIVNKIKGLGFVRSVYPVAYTQGLIKMPDEVEGIVFKGIDSAYNFSFLEGHIVEGKLPLYGGDETSNDVVISAVLSKALGLSVGDKIETYFVRDDIKVRRFVVTAIYSTGMDDMDRSLVYGDIRHARKINGWGAEEVSGYELITEKSGMGEGAVYKMGVEDCIFLENGDVPEEELSDSIIVNTSEELFYNLYDWLNLIDLNVLIILILMIAVSGFNMVSGVLILIFERMSHIGLLKALGMRNGSIVKIFMFSAARIILAGLLVGNVVALLFCAVQKFYRIIPLDSSNYFVSSVPISFAWGWIIGVNLILLVAIMIILFMPLHFIQKVSPAKTLVSK